MPDSTVGLALIDYDNVRPNKDERASDDVAHNLALIFEAIAQAAKSIGQSELRARLYGGWITQHGAFSYRANLVISALVNSRGIYGGVRILPELATSPIVRPDCRLVGTLRTDRRPIAQKMVDTLMASDAAFVAPSHQLLFATSDEDLVPAFIHSSVLSPKHVVLIRHRAGGLGLNDAQLRALKVEFAQLPWEP